ncbi:MAG: LCP family protein [Oscillospiraceae bacterium]|nr:LCP family protein [Oscillospiraceae bacterium]
MRRNWAVRILVLLASVSLVLGGLSMLSARRPYWSGSELSGKISTPSPASRSARNILVAGVTESGGAALAEMVLLINLDLETGKAGVMYLPGNTLVGADEVKYGRLSGAVNWGTADETSGGAAALADCIADCFVLPVDNYYLFDMDILPQITERLGGVRVSLENELSISETETLEAGDHIFRTDDVKKYILSTDGTELETVNRLRATFMEGVIRAFLGMPEKEALALVKENKGSIDTDLSVREHKILSEALYEKSGSMIDYFTVPGRMVSGYGSYRLTVWSVRRAEAAALINDRLRAHTDHVLAEDMSVPEIPA